MGSRPIDPKELLKGLDCFLGKDGEVKSHEGITKIFNLMKDAQKMVSRCIYLNILLQTRAQDILSKFIKVGGYKLLNTWLTSSKASSNVPLLQQILLTLQHLPLTVDHLKQNNTAKLVKQLSKTSDDEELRRLASILVSDWMGVIRSQSSSQPTEREKKKRKEENRSKVPSVQEKPQETKSEVKPEEAPEKKKEKPKSLRTTAPSHAKFRSTGLEMETPSLIPVKKNINTEVAPDKYSFKPIPLKRHIISNPVGDNPPVEKKYKPLNTTPNATKEIKVKIIPAQPMEGLGFLDALNSAPVPEIKIKKKKKVLSPTAAKPSPFEGKPVPETAAAKPSSPELNPASEPMDVDRPGTPVPAVEVPEPMETNSSEHGGLLDSKSTESPADSTQLTKKGKKKKTVSWPEENKLREYFYFELDETERVNVNKIKDFGEAAKREIMLDRHAFETARRLSHDAMEEKVPWVYPKPIDLPAPLVQPGSGSQEKFTQAEREKGILQEIFLSKESVPDSPHEPDPESYEPVPPKLIPLDEECSMDEATYDERLDPSTASQSPDGAGGSKLPPVLANLMGSMGAGKNPQGPNPSSSSINMQEILTSIMGGSNNHKTEELMKQPDYSDKIKHLLGNLQGQPGPGPSGVPHGLLGPGPGPVPNGFPPGPKNMQHFPPGGPGPMPGPHGGPGGPNMPPGPGVPNGPRMMGPPPPQCNDGYWDPPDGGMRGGPHGGMRGGSPGPGPGPGPFHRGRGGRGGEPPFRGRGGGRSGGPPNGRGGPPNNSMGGGHGGGHGSGGHGGGHGGGGHGGHGGGGHPGDHGRGHPGGHPGDHSRGHPGGHPGDHGRGYPGDHSRGHPGDHGRGHPGDHGWGHGGGHGGDRSKRPVCRHFTMKGSCRYENNCAFYHPGVNGPPLP
ncbi:serine/threonine-protein phosphatase 1 regulatory subunit 10 isoform X1 [Pseudonaja textilis]|uniref:Serine/threonine-protein phosphatase 1 regulatory subunit 10 n=1 Tax=Pseudonaja textilis TaxID=8673 RepID=A0A670YZV8_PSETE|nr:serine/threonine-protein phosphatase 1 regulatory subunit 10 isoform X1 [Pseudonaja textilis]XP_026576535.1 serine/threonine-protein phosphatase 1 regulatory subunit 10 isoform X1 [Pseudonaja textilis]XP_026576536.1 serine/threonine-protein phosphatase 1 regulatory subunit 10 isoform X1 [Pseudonaja textilis]